jgi:hypothetical protein
MIIVNDELERIEKEMALDQSKYLSWYLYGVRKPKGKFS